MNPLRKWIRDAFGFSGNEINGFMILIPLMLVVVFSEPIYRSWIVSQPPDFTHDAARLDSLLVVSRAAAKKAVNQHVNLFEFDPNRASVAELRGLGFTEISSTRIAAYRAKGGVFRVKSDLLKIYGLDSALYKRLYTYIDLPSGPLPHQKRAEKERRRSPGNSDQKRFDINTADTLLLKTVNGIGPVLATRIVKFRDALGGFVKPEQLYEVYGLDSTVVVRLLKTGFIERDFVPARLNINTADERTLSGHPYIRKKIAAALVRYRFQHGDFADINDIKKLSVMQSGEAERLLPYLKTVE